jgi:hypothetical protein
MKKIITTLLTLTMLLNVFAVSADEQHSVTTKNGSETVDISEELTAEEVTKTIFYDNQADFEKIADYFQSSSEEKTEVDFESDEPNFPEEIAAELANLKNNYDIISLEAEPGSYMLFYFFPKSESLFDMQVDWELTPLPMPEFYIIYAEDISALPKYYSDAKSIEGNWYYSVKFWNIDGLTGQEWNSPIGDKYADIRYVDWVKRYLHKGNTGQLTNSYSDFDGDGNLTAIDLALLKNKVLTYDYYASSVVLPKPEDVAVPSDGDNFTVVSWDANDVPYLLSAWKGDMEFLESNTDTNPDNDIPWLESDTYNNSNVKFVQLDAATSSDAPELYNAMFAAGDDVDVFFCENSFSLKYMDDDRTLPLSQIGLSEENFPYRYKYTDALGTSEDGELKGLTWQAAPGGFAYRADLAEEYLGVTTPAEMQAKIRNWVNFEKTAKTLHDATGGNVAMVGAMDNLWPAYSQNKSLPWLDESGSLQIDPNIESFMDYAKNMRDSGYVGDKQMWTVDWLTWGQTDYFLGYFASTWGLSDSILMSAAGGVDGKTYGKWALCKGPQEYFWGGTWLAVNSDTDNGLDAQSFLYSVCGDSSVMRQYALLKGDFVNNTRVMNQIVDSGVLTVKNADGTYKNKAVGNLGGQDYFAELDKVANSIELYRETVNEKDGEINEKFIDAVRTYCDGDFLSKEDALASFVEDAKA